MKKAAVVSLNAPGFIGNRMLAGYTHQANMLLLEGALPNQVDSALESFGMSMGPFRMLDLVGLDLGWRARKLADIETPLANKISDELCERDRFGQKNSKGFYKISAMMTLAPSDAALIAIALPIPDAPPVTIITLCCRRIFRICLTCYLITKLLAHPY